MKKLYNSPKIIVVEHKGLILMLDTSGGGTGGVVTPPRSKDTEMNDIVSPRSIWESDEEE